jgi:hypothetical protein
MMPAPNADPLLPVGAPALEIPSDRPAFYDSFKISSVPAAATAVRLGTPLSERSTSRPQSITVYMPSTPPVSVFLANMRVASAYIAPGTAPCCADPKSFIRRVFRTLAPDLPQPFKVLVSVDGYIAVIFRTPDDREAAMRRQPFELDGATVTLVIEEGSGDVNHAPYIYMAHVALRDYPVEQRTEVDIAANCSRFGFVREVDPACFAAPDLATVHVVLQLEHPREIPHQVRIWYQDDYTSVVPVEIVRLWDCAHSYEAGGRQYVPLFQQA